MKKLIALFALLALCLNQAIAQESDIVVYPVPAVFMSKEVQDNNKLFSSVYQQNRADFIKQYVDIFSSIYKNTTNELSDKNKYKTFAAYINIPRVSENPYKRGEVLDIYLPMTMSINFVNMATSEVLFSYPLTEYSGFSTSLENSQNTSYINGQISKAYIDNYRQLLNDVVTKSSENFKPFVIEAKVKDSYRSLYVLDKGTTAGIAKGDLLVDGNDNQLSVIYSTLDYSVAQALLGKPSINSTFNKFANSTITQLKKPKVLFINDLGSEKYYNIFSTELGSNADFSLMTVDATFNKMINDLASLNMTFSSKNAQNREVPDYFLKLYLTEPVYTRFPSNKDFYNTDKYSMLACGVIFDKSGRVVFSKCVDDEITDSVVSDMKFSQDERFEVLTKNILNKLALAFQSEVKFKNLELNISKTDGEYIFINDKAGILNVGNTISIFKKVKTEKGGAEILIPTWEYKIISINGEDVECKPMFPIVDGLNFPSKSDKVLLTAITKADNHANMFKFLPDGMELKGNQVKLDDFKNIAFASLASSMKSPISFDNVELAEQIKELNEGYGFKKKIDTPINSSNLTIKPVYKIELIETKKYHNLIRQKYKIIVGIKSYKDNEMLKQQGLSQEIEFSVKNADDSKRIQYELLKNISLLLQQLSVNF